MPSASAPKTTSSRGSTPASAALESRKRNRYGCSVSSAPGASSNAASTLPNGSGRDASAGARATAVAAKSIDSMNVPQGIVSATATPLAASKPQAWSVVSVGESTNGPGRSQPKRPASNGVAARATAVSSGAATYGNSPP